MRTLGLDLRHGRVRSALECLESSQQALNAPFTDQGYETAVLVPLREAIEVSIEELLKRRREQRPTGGWQSKVRDLGVQLGKPVLSETHFERVGATTHTLIKELSGGKSYAMTREGIAALFDQGVSLLGDICRLVDMSKLR